ncbi:MAG: hypothetical protein DRI46_10925 [Chloroflexi bacterium]|nr:MAG: hypothetical protein DRI46_10925 [Chloroflexota bacterium]
MIAKSPKKMVNKTKGQGYQRKKFQKTMDEYKDMGDRDSAYARSAIDAPPIEYNEGGDRI